MNTGDIYWVNLAPTLGDEIRKTRPVVIVNGGHSKYLKLAIVVPHNRLESELGRQSFFCLPAAQRVQCPLEKKSAIDCYQLRSLSHQRFLEKLGQISPAEMDVVKKAVALILDIEPEHCT